MSMRTLLALLLVFSTSLLASPAVAEASDSKRAAAKKRISTSKRIANSNRISRSNRFPSTYLCRQPVIRSCSLHNHEHVITAGISFFNRRNVCLRRLAGGTIQRWRPATSRIQCRIVPGIPTFRTVTRYRTIRRCGIPVRVPYLKTIKIPGKDRTITERVHVPGEWLPYKLKRSRRYGSQLSFLQYPRN